MNDRVVNDGDAADIRVTDPIDLENKTLNMGNVYNTDLPTCQYYIPPPGPPVLTLRPASRPPGRRSAKSPTTTSKRLKGRLKVISLKMKRKESKSLNPWLPIRKLSFSKQIKLLN